jgi:hypothetical protein
MPSVRMLNNYIISGVPYRAGDLVSLDSGLATQLAAGGIVDYTQAAVDQAIADGEVLRYPEADYLLLHPVASTDQVQSYEPSVTAANSFYSVVGGGTHIINGGSPVILDSCQVRSGNENGAATALNNYILFQDDTSGVTFLKLLGGFKVAGQDGFFEWNDGFYVPRLKLFLAGDDYVTVAWRLPQ